MKNPLIIHHGNCPDGFGAAWWLGKQFLEHDKFSAGYGQAPPLELCRDRFVFIVDFAYETAHLNNIIEASSGLLVLDHHQTAHEWLKAAWMPDVTEDMGGGVEDGGAGYIYDVDRSGAGLVADYVKARWGFGAPAFMRNLQDRDLWKFELPNTGAVLSAITSRPYTDEAWNEAMDMGLDALVAEGAGIERYRQQLIESAVRSAYEAKILGHLVWVTACPFNVGSDVAGELAKRKPDLFGAYYVDYGGHRRYGLRSTADGMDVAKLAELLSGGGHKHASGFEVPFDNGIIHNPLALHS